jgi:hypothetical protein
MNYLKPCPFVRGLCATALLLVTGSVHGGTLFISRLSGANENPANSSTYTGTGVLILNDAGNSATVTAMHNIDVPLTGGHIHRGSATVNGPVIFPFAAPSSPVGPLTWAISTADVDSLKNQGTYMNFHTAAFPGGVIRGTLMRALLAPAAMTPVQMRLADALDISAGYSTDLDAILVGANLASASVQTAVLKELSGGTLHVQTREQLEAMGTFQSTLFAHIDTMRATSPGNDRASLFLRVGDEFGDRDASDNQLGSSVNHPFALIGTEYQVGPSTRLGGTLGYAAGTDEFDAGVGETEVKTLAISGFATFGIGDTGVVLDGTAGYGWSSIDTTRNLASLGRTATGSTDGAVWNAAMRASKAFGSGTRSRLVPYLLVDVQKADADAYAESGAGAANLIVPEREMWGSAIEGGAVWTMGPQSGGTGLHFRLQGAWRYLLDDGGASSGTWLEGSPIGFTTYYDGLETNNFRVEVATDWVLQSGGVLTLAYRGLLSSGTQQLHTLEAGFALRF